jgi:hypothetical protein
MRNLLERLGEMRPGEVPVLSVYLDLCTQASGGGPAYRPGVALARQMLRELERAQTQPGRARDSLCFDIRRIHRYLEWGIRPSTRGAAIFACADRGVFEVVDVDVPFDTAVTLRPLPELVQLARLEAWDVHRAPIHPGEPDDLLATGTRGHGWRLA